jgi:hypothetical protein
VALRPTLSGGLPLSSNRRLKIPAASCWESSTVRNVVYFFIRSLTPPQAAGNALAFAVQKNNDRRIKQQKKCHPGPEKVVPDRSLI